MFLDAAQFEFVPRLEANWQTIRREFEAVPTERLVPWKETFLYKKGWDVFGLYAFGRRDEAGCALCPRTAEQVEAIPGLVTAGFSRLEAGTVIQPHVGYTYSLDEANNLVTDRTPNKSVLRGHLGLIVPWTPSPLGCALRVGQETRTWTEGRCLVFDDTVVHAAWNRSGEPRVVLLFDFKREAA